MLKPESSGRSHEESGNKTQGNQGRGKMALDAAALADALKRRPEKSQADAAQLANALKQLKGESKGESKDGTIRKAQHNPALKRALLTMGGVLLAGAVAFGSAKALYESNGPSFPRTEETGNNNAESEQENFESLTGIEALDETIDGSFTQYDNIGCYESDGKVNPNSVGNPDEILMAMGVNPDEATAEQRGTAQEYLAYSMEEAAAGIAVASGLEGFMGLSQEEAEDMIHNMSPEDRKSTRLNSSHAR